MPHLKETAVVGLHVNCETLTSSLTLSGMVSDWGSKSH